MGDWAEAKTTEGRPYYWNKTTKETVWERPDDFDAESAAAPATPVSTKPEDWGESTASDGRKYWYNKITRETTWQMPAILEQSVALAQKPNGRPDFVAGGLGRDHGRQGFDDRALQRRDDRSAGLPQKPSFDGPRGGGGGGMPWEGRAENTGFRGAIAKTDEPEYATAEQAEEAFFKLLRRNSVAPDAEWRDVLKLVVRDREYRAIKDPKERKMAFERYCREVREQERGKEKERRERLREDFRSMLSTHDDIKHYTRWKTARPLIEREAVFKSAGDDSERRKMYDEYLVELKRKHAESETKRRREAMQQLDSMLKALIIDPDARWAEAEDKIMNNDRFHTVDIFRTLHKVDVFSAFEGHIKHLERTTNDALQQEKQLRRRRERQARDGFKQLLSEQQREGKIRAGTKWQDLISLISNDERYLAYLGMPGSEPIELFWDIVEDEERKLRSKRNDALDVLEEKRWEMTLETPFQEFADIMARHPKTANLEEDDVRLIFDRLMDKVKRRQEESKLDAERHQRNLVDSLRSAIKRLDPPVRSDDSYEDVAKRLSGHRDFETADEDSRRSAFEKYTRRLKERDDQERERRRDRERERDPRNGSRRDDRERDRRHRTRSPEIDAYEADRRKAQEARERSYRKPSFGLTPPPRDRRDDRYERDSRRDRPESVSVYERERREREMERERSYISRADPRDKGRTLDYGDDDAVGSLGSRPGSIRKRRDSEGSMSSRRESKRTRRDHRTRSPEPEGLLKDDPPALQSGSEEGEIEEI